MDLKSTMLLIGLAIVFACSPEQPVADEDELDIILRSPINTDGSIDSTNLAIIEFETLVYEFDTISQGEKVDYSFLFKNVGKADLLISDVQSSCGCTITNYEKGPLQAGQESKIDFTFDSTDKEGIQDKSITVYANTYPNRTILKFKGFVIK